MAKTKVLVTGGTGFVGSTLVRHLLESDYGVRVLARPNGNRTLLEGLNVEIFEGDVTMPEAVEKATEGCSVIFNLASIYAFCPFWEKKAKDIYDTNVQGTINLLNAALKNRVRRFIHTSTIATIGKRRDGKPADENTELDFKNANHYARSKYLAEQEVLKFCRKGLPAIILNPAIIIGAGDYKPTPSGEVIVKFLNRSYPGYFQTVWSVVDVDNVAGAHIYAIEHGRIGEKYILCNKKPISLKELFKLVEKISGIKSPWLRIPYPLLFIFTHIEEFLSYKVFKKYPIMPTEGVKFCRMTGILDNSKAIKELNYTSIPLEETLKKAVTWYRRNGYVEPRGFFRFKALGNKNVKLIMHQLGIHKYADKLSIGTLVFYSIVKTLHLLKKIGFRPKFDGWRKTTQCYLRSEHSKFTLAAFGLDFWSDAEADTPRTFESAKKHLIARLSQFIRQEPNLHWRLSWHKFYAQKQKNNFIDIVSAEFDKEGNLQNIEPYFSTHINPELNSSLIVAFVKIYNKARNLNDKKRPIFLKNKLKKKFLWNRDAQNFIERILSATFVHFEILSDLASSVNQDRFHPPRFIKAKHPGFGFLNITCRFTSDLTEADLWIQYSHISADGVPMQEVLNKLKKQWGVVKSLESLQQSPKEKIIPELYSTKNSRRRVYHINEFLDFRPFMQLRQKLNKHYKLLLQYNITVVSLFIWKLSHQAIFEDAKFAIPVDLPEKYGRERTLGFIFIRPSIYFNRYSPDKGFFDFQQEFNHQLIAVRKRNSESYHLLESFALVPPFIYTVVLKLMHAELMEFVGSLGVTIIREADLFIAPYSEVHTAGFIAVSKIRRQEGNNNRFCNVSIKGPKDKILAYFDAIKEIANSDAL